MLENVSYAGTLFLKSCVEPVRAELKCVAWLGPIHVLRKISYEQIESGPRQIRVNGHM